MGMATALIKGVLGWCWKWSGCPLLVLVAVPALVLQTKHLAGPHFAPVNDSGARVAWNRLTHRSEYSHCFFGGGRSIHIVEEDRRYTVLTLEQLEDSSFDHIDQDHRYYFYLNATIRSEHGFWAKTTRKVHVGLPYLHGPMRVAEWPDRDFKVVSEDLAEAYRVQAINQHGMFDTRVYQWIMRGEESFTESIPTGYAHNALALFLVGTTGRGLFGSRRWWRELRERFRSKKNRCVVCGYNLRGLTRGRCPECGVLIPDRHAEIYTSRDEVPERDHTG